MIGAIDGGALLELAWVAPLTVIAVSVTFSLCVLGATRAADHRRGGSRSAATVYGALALLAGLAFAAEIVLGVGVIVNG